MHQAGTPFPVTQDRSRSCSSEDGIVDSLSVSLLQRLAVVVMSPRALSSSALLLLVGALVAIVAAVAAGVSRAVLLVPGAQRLSAKHEVLVLDDDGLDPRLGVEFKLVGGRLHGL